MKKKDALHYCNLGKLYDIKMCTMFIIRFNPNFSNCYVQFENLKKIHLLGKYAAGSNYSPKTTLSDYLVKVHIAKCYKLRCINKILLLFEFQKGGGGVQAPLLGASLHAHHLLITLQIISLR